IAGSKPGTGFDGFVVTLGLTNVGVTLGGAWLGGNGIDEVQALATNPFVSGSMYAAGVTDSTNLTTLNPVQASNAGGNDAFVARLAAGGSGAAEFVTYLGGSGNDTATSVAVPPQTGGLGVARAYVVGETGSNNFGATATYSPNAPADPPQPDNAGNG